MCVCAQKMDLTWEAGTLQKMQQHQGCLHTGFATTSEEDLKLGKTGILECIGSLETGSTMVEYTHSTHVLGWCMEIASIYTIKKHNNKWVFHL